MTMTEYYKEKLEQGLCYQDFVVDQLYKIGLPLIAYSSKKYQNLVGENKNGIEIKNDAKRKDTGNIYIETAEKTNANNEFFVASGIYRNDNSWLYLIGDYKRIFIFSKKHLLRLHKLRNNDGSPRFKNIEIATSKGFLIPEEEADNIYALRVIECSENGGE